MKARAKNTVTANGVFDVNWKRVVLDEAHTIKNHHTEAAKVIIISCIRTQELL
jgi:SNF2 family DNA or RNA helicase